ncbi:uncharacterized protein [Anser cygnoides]|uniref:uncharacterized protein n=1 Tax=Anser cygnoides TaxID=8845 RepID=UPI0034D1C20E
MSPCWLPGHLVLILPQHLGTCPGAGTGWTQLAGGARLCSFAVLRSNFPFSPLSIPNPFPLPLPFNFPCPLFFSPFLLSFLFPPHFLPFLFPSQLCFPFSLSFSLFSFHFLSSLSFPFSSFHSLPFPFFSFPFSFLPYLLSLSFFFHFLLFFFSIPRLCLFSFSSCFPFPFHLHIFFFLSSFPSFFSPHFPFVSFSPPLHFLLIVLLSFSFPPSPSPRPFSLSLPSPRSPRTPTPTSRSRQLPRDRFSPARPRWAAAEGSLRGAPAAGLRPLPAAAGAAARSPSRLGRCPRTSPAPGRPGGAALCPPSR